MTLIEPYLILLQEEVGTFAMITGLGARRRSSRPSHSMLPAFVDEFEAVAVEVEDLCGVVAGIVVKLRAGWMNLARTGRQCGRMSSANHGFGVGDEADMHRPW